MNENGQFDGGDSILDIDTSGAIEPSAVEAGEYELEITGYKSTIVEDRVVFVNTGDYGRYFVVLFSIPNEIHSKGLSKIIPVPDKDNDTPKDFAKNEWALDCFKRAFGLTSINFRSVGQRGYALLSCDADPTYGAQNKIKKFITGA